MGREQWQQMNLDGGDVLVIPRVTRRGEKSKKKKENPDLTAVNRFLGWQRRALYDETGQAPMPSFLSLTSKQLRIYYARQAAAAEEAAAALAQRQAEELGLTNQTFYLDREVELEKSCGCGRNFVRQTVTMRSGRKQHRGLTRLLVNEYCSSCGFESSGREYQFWVPNGQIVRKE